MPRTKGQTRITISLSEVFLEAIDKRRGTVSRSEFVRRSVAEALGLGEDLAAAPDRVGKGGRPSHRGKVYEVPDPVPQLVADDSRVIYSLPYLGAVAAGAQVDAEVAESVAVPRPYERGHFVVRVSGESMEPELEDGDLIVVDGRDAHTPGHGRVCVVSDGSGSSVKVWNRRRRVFESINPEHPDLEAGDEVVFRGYYVEKVKPIELEP